MFRWGRSFFLFIPLYATLLISFISGAVEFSRAGARFFAVLQGLSAVFVMVAFLIYVIGAGRGIPIIQNGLKYVIVSLLILFYGLFSVFLGYFHENSASYVIGDAFRYLIFPIFFVAFVAIFSRSSDDFLDCLVWHMLFIAILGGIGKLILVVFGKYYGAGLNQYFVGVFVLIYVVGSLVLKVHFRKRFFWWGFVFVSVFLSVLSMKRFVWLGVFFSFLALLYFLPVAKKLRLLMVFLIASSAAAVLLYQFSGLDILLSRFDSILRFLETGSLGSSGLQRMLENSTSIETLVRSGFPSILFGLGSGAEFYNEDPTILRNVGSQEFSVHHIHSFYYLMLFRYGLIGAVLYLIPILFLLLAFSRRMARTKNINFQLLVGFSCCAELFFGLMGALKGNAFYGGFGYAYFAAGVFHTLLVLRNKKIEARSSR